MTAPAHLLQLAADRKATGSRGPLPSDGGKSDFAEVNAALQALREAQEAVIKAAADHIVKALVRIACESLVQKWMANPSPLETPKHRFKVRLKIERRKRKRPSPKSGDIFTIKYDPPLKSRLDNMIRQLWHGPYARGGIVGKKPDPNPKLIDPNESLFPRILGTKLTSVIVDDLQDTKTLQSCKLRFDGPSFQPYRGFTVADPGRRVGSWQLKPVSHLFPYQGGFGEAGEVKPLQCRACCDLGYVMRYVSDYAPFKRVPCPSARCEARDKTREVSYTLRATPFDGPFAGYIPGTMKLS